MSRWDRLISPSKPRQGHIRLTYSPSRAKSTDNPSEAGHWASSTQCCIMDSPRPKLSSHPLWWPRPAHNRGQSRTAIDWIVPRVRRIGLPFSISSLLASAFVCSPLATGIPTHALTRREDEESVRWPALHEDTEDGPGCRALALSSPHEGDQPRKMRGLL